RPARSPSIRVAKQDVVAAGGHDRGANQRGESPGEQTCLATTRALRVRRPGPGAAARTALGELQREVGARNREGPRADSSRDGRTNRRRAIRRGRRVGKLDAAPRRAPPEGLEALTFPPWQVVSSDR